MILRDYAPVGTAGLAGSCRDRRALPTHKDSADAAIPSVSAATVAAALDASGERDRASAALLAAEARGFERGATEGYLLGVGDRLEAVASAQREILPLVRRVADQPDAAEMERRRWTLRGEVRTRESFADPHPGDFMPDTPEALAARLAAWDGAGK